MPPTDIKYGTSYVRIPFIITIVCQQMDEAEFNSGSPFKELGAPKRSGLSPGLLRSILQKNVRRGHAAESTRVALDLAAVDYASFVRRIPIIMVEVST